MEGELGYDLFPGAVRHNGKVNGVVVELRMVLSLTPCVHILRNLGFAVVGPVPFCSEAHNYNGKKYNSNNNNNCSLDCAVNMPRHARQDIRHTQHERRAFIISSLAFFLGGNGLAYGNLEPQLVPTPRPTTEKNKYFPNLGSRWNRGVPVASTASINTCARI